jgi:hypothetical protein
MADKRKAGTFKLFDFRNFSVREALWIAILLHLVILILPQSANPFVLFWRELEPVQPEPITFAIKQPPEPESEITRQPEKQRAISPEKLEGPPETEQPTMRGQTNLKALESPPAGSEQTPASRSSSAETGLKKSESLRDLIPRNPEEKALEKAEQRRRLAEALENPRIFKPSDFPIIYDSPKPSKADYLDNIIRFDTYNWNYVPYRDKLIRKLYYYWVPKLDNLSYFRLGYTGVSVYRFVIRRDGSLRQVELFEPAAVAPYDMAARHAIVSPYPGLVTAFEPLPDDFPKNELTVTVGFFVNMKAPR